jgi:hypothetical protein
MARRSYRRRSRTTREVDQQELAEEYQYVINDLRSMGILAAAMFALLIILALVLA